MSTSDPSAALDLAGREVPAELRGTALDPAVIQRIALELFRTQPGDAAAEIPALSAPSAPPVVVVPPTDSLAPGLSAPPGASVPLPPTVPSAPRRGGDALYFLAEARAFATLGVTPAIEPAPVAPAATPALGLAPAHFDAASLRRDFPILQERVRGRPLVWLDNAATTQKPRAVIERLAEFYERENSNIHRAAHALAARATDAYEGAREKVRRFLGAGSTKEIVFVRGATEGVNLVAQGWGRRHVGPGDEIVLTWLEHHSNIVPWQMLAAERGARLRIAPVDDDGQVLLDEFEKLLGPRTRIVAITHVSNALGTVLPVAAMTEMARRRGARVLVDGAQAVSHMPVDVRQIGCDFYVLSGHKVFAPTGIGVLYGRSDALEEVGPWQGGGNMIADVTFEKTTYAAAPARFEAGTGNIADAVGLGAAIDYLEGIGMHNVARYEHELIRSQGRHLTPRPSS